MLTKLGKDSHYPIFIRSHGSFQTWLEQKPPSMLTGGSTKHPIGSSLRGCRTILHIRPAYGIDGQPPIAAAHGVGAARPSELGND